MKKLLLMALTVAATLAVEKALAQDERKTNKERVENTKADVRRESREVKKDAKKAGRKMKRSAKKATGDAAEEVERGAGNVKRDVRNNPN